MRSNTLHFVTNLFETLGIATAIILVGAIATVKAQDNLSRVRDSSFNGLFTPTAAQRFYETGRKDFEREADFLAAPKRYLIRDILQIDPELQEQIRENKPIGQPQPDNFYELDIEIQNKN
ncbi:hypothetical protein [Myxosarcina sp. GI1(2024)]